MSNLIAKAYYWVKDQDLGRIIKTCPIFAFMILEPYAKIHPLNVMFIPFLTEIPKWASRR